MTTLQPAMTTNRRLLLGFPGFAVATLALTGISGWLLTIAFRGPADGSAIATSAVLALVIQLAAFPAVRALAAKNIMLGWGAGSLVRFLSLIVYAALVAAKALLLPLPAALISLLVFYFLSMVIEPLFLRP